MFVLGVYFSAQSSQIVGEQAMLLYRYHLIHVLCIMVEQDEL